MTHVSKILVALTLFCVVLTSCGGDDKESAACTEKKAREVKQAFITNDTFDADCVKVRKDTQFFFINNDEQTHTVTSQGDAPEPFDAELPKKGSTYAQTFKTSGRYEVLCKRHQEKLTLFVF